MDAGQASGISLWLMPQGALRERLATLIRDLAARFGTEPFPPHVTLLPGLAGPEAVILEASRSLAAVLRPLTIRLLSVDGRDEHFRCLFARAEADEPLRAAHAAAARAFDREPDPALLPHLSLVYGTLPPETKWPLAAEVAAAVAVSFAARRLHVWRTEGPVGDWREIGAFPLRGEADSD
jgi:2'-5' RNA ligase